MEIRFKNEVYDLSIPGIRKALHVDVEEAFAKIDEPEENDFVELESIHELISNQDINALISGYFLNGEIQFLQVVSDDLLINALEKAGYQVEQSRASRSLYAFNDGGQEVRISDHKRPAIVQHGAYIGEHEYEVEIIIQDNEVSLSSLIANGFSKLSKEKYLLG